MLHPFWLWYKCAISFYQIVYNWMAFFLWQKLRGRRKCIRALFSIDFALFHVYCITLWYTSISVWSFSYSFFLQIQKNRAFPPSLHLFKKHLGANFCTHCIQLWKKSLYRIVNWEENGNKPCFCFALWIGWENGGKARATV